jgi:16S rRNA G966 N2-methylase RsmD
MDLINNNPNIIMYNILNKYINNNSNSEYFKNICLSDYDYYQENNNNYFLDDEINFNNEINDEINSDNEEDAWESAINDDKFYINNKIARIFPILKNFNNFSKIKIDDDSFCFITIREIADIISKIICYHLLEHNLNPQKAIIADYTSGVGGNILSFCKFFKFVYAIELDEVRAEYLENNINIYGFNNIKIIVECALKFNDNELLNTNPNIIFIDPPWGGSNYKNNETMTLNLGSMEIEKLVIDITQKFSDLYINIVNLNPKEKFNTYNNKFIILKLPKNYDIEYFYNYMKLNNNFINYNIMTYLYILNKMIIIVCELQYKNL